jgi:hypothetical protein
MFLHTDNRTCHAGGIRGTYRVGLLLDDGYDLGLSWAQTWICTPVQYAARAGSLVSEGFCDYELHRRAW